MNRIRVIGLAIMVTFAVCAVAVTSASAFEFKAAEYPVTNKAKTTNFQGFEVLGATSVCETGTFNTGEEGAVNPPLEDEILLVHPKYESCTISLAGTFKAKVKTEGCNYRFHAAKPETTNGTVDVVCAAGKQIEVVAEGLEGCTLSVGSQNGLKTILYKNEAGKVKVSAENSAIKYKATAGCGIALEGENAKYREGELVAGVAKLAPEGKPANALSEGFNEAAAPDAVEVTSTIPAHYFVGGLSEAARAEAGVKIPTIAWGTLSLTNLKTGGKVECHNVVGAVIENPEPGGAEGPHGLGETLNFATYECESAACTPAATKSGPATYISVKSETMAEPFPETGNESNRKWIGHLLSEGSTIRGGSEHVKVNVICHVNTGFNVKGEPEFGVNVEEKSEGANQPKGVTKCCKATAPPELEFDAGSGTLKNEKGEKGKTEGKLKTLGYKEEEIINSKAG